MIRAWYWSRLFWLGVPGFLFLIWLWCDSMFYWTSAILSWEVAPQDPVFGPSLAGCQMSITSGQLYLGDVEDPFAPLPGRFGVSWHLSRTAAADLYSDPFATQPVELQYALTDWFPEPLSSFGDDPFAPGRFAVAFWCFLLGYLGLWLGAICLRQRRKRHRLKMANLEQTNLST